MNADQQQPEQFEARSPLARLRGSAGRLTASKGPLRTRWNALRQRPFIAAAFVLSLLAAFYWYVVASDRYLSEAHVVVQQTDLAMAPTTDLVSLLTGDSSGDRADQLMMREYLMSRDVVKKLNAELDLQGHYSSWSIDPLSRLNFANSDGDLYRYFLSRVTVEYDEYPGVLVVSAQAYTPEMAQRITQRMIEEGEAFMNSTAHNLASNQVEFLQERVDALETRARDARAAVLSYQNRERLASPEAQAETITALIAQLESRRSQLQVQIASQSAFLVDDHPVLVELRRQLAAVDRQIAEQNDRLAGPRGGALNRKAEEFERLQAEAKFANDLYLSAIGALEQGQVESTRTIKSLSVIQSPNLPQEAELPERTRKTLVFVIFAFLIAGVLQLLVMIIRDHRD